MKSVDRSVHLYNHDKPHCELKRKSPVHFENEYICVPQKSDEGKESISSTPFLSKENLNSKHQPLKTVNAI